MGTKKKEVSVQQGRSRERGVVLLRWQRVGLEGGLVWDFDNFIILGRAEVNQGGRKEK